jgi:hypothetical protein
MKRNFAGGIPLIVLIAIGAVRLSAQKAVSGGPDAMATDEQMNAYLLPAIAAEGGPAYVVPGEVTGDSTVSLTAAAGVVCLRIGYCTNAAGITTPVYGIPASSGRTSTFTANIGGFPGTWNFGALLMSIEGVGTVQVFQADGANGLHSEHPPTSFSLTESSSGLPEVTSYRTLGFPKFKVHNARITFFVADDYYADNSGDFILSRIAPTLTYNPDTTKKVVQTLGPCDWAAWDFKPATAKTAASWGPCEPTAASGEPSQILGEDLGYSFENPKAKKLIFLFGDAIGVEIPTGDSLVPASSMCPPSTSPPTPQTTQCFVNFQAHDAIAETGVDSTAENFHLNFLSVRDTANGVPDAPLFVTPTNQQPGNIPVSMSTDDVPNSGIDLNGQDYILVKTGHSATAGDEFAYSVLVKYKPEDPIPFQSGRTISIANIEKEECIAGYCAPSILQDGHFVIPVPHELPLAYAQQIGLSEPGVLIYGNGEYRSESIYLSYIPASQFWSGVDGQGNSSTQYFMGLDANGRPMWTDSELCAVPVVYDNPTNLPVSPGCIVQNPFSPQPVDPGTAGNVSVSYNKELSQWLMTWDGGRQSPSTLGIYFSYASEPWGPWSTPQLVYSPCQAASYGEGLGSFIRYPAISSDDSCSSAEENTGPEGPIIGTGDVPFTNDGASGDTVSTRRGAVYAPFQIERFARVADDGTLSIFFNMSTWNPYTVVLMQSDYTVGLRF